MSLQAILDAIKATGDAQVQEIEDHASVQAHEIMAENLLAAQLAKEQAFKGASLPAERERSRLLHLAHLESMQMLGNTRDTLVDKAIEKIHECLFHYRADPNYPSVLSRLVQETLSSLEGSFAEVQSRDQSFSNPDHLSPDQSHDPMKAHEILIMADPRDQGILENILTTMKLELPDQEEELFVQFKLECWGGIIARSMDGRINSVNTLEARLERATPVLRRFLAAFFETVTHPVIDKSIDTTNSNPQQETMRTGTDDRTPMKSSGYVELTGNV